MRPLHVVRRGGICLRWSYSIVDLAHFAVLRLFPTSAGWDALVSSNSPVFDALLVNSVRVVTPSRYG